MPVVTISMIADKIENEPIEDLPNAIVTDISTAGFSIVLSDSAKEDIQFFWMALSIREMEITVGGEVHSLQFTVDGEEEEGEATLSAFFDASADAVEATLSAEVEITP